MQKSGKIVALNPFTRARLSKRQRSLKDQYLITKIEDVAHKAGLIKSLSHKLGGVHENDLLLKEVTKVLHLSETFLALVANPDLGEKDRASQMLMAGYTLKRQQRILKDLRPTQAVILLRRLSRFFGRLAPLT